MNCLLFPQSSPLSAGWDSDFAKHIRDVLHTREGETVFAGNINGALHICRVHFTSGGAVELTPVRPAPNPELKRIFAAVAFTRPQIAKRILFEAACLGASEIVFYPADKGDSSYLKSSLYATGEYIKYLEKGAMQACSTFLPKFRAAESLEQALSFADAFFPARRFAPDVYEASVNLYDVPPRSAESVALILGGERGYTNAERDVLRARGWVLASLSDRVLRTDTAFISALSAASSLLRG